MLPLALSSAPGQRRGIGSRATFPSLAREMSAGPVLVPQVVLLHSSGRCSTRFSLVRHSLVVCVPGAKGVGPLPSCIPSLHGRYSASTLLWML
jgi:hypothetical protein